MASENLAPSTSNESDTSSVSMVDVLREEEELEADATAVLGDSDVHNCTYPTGYIPRQALYACLTCKGHAGVCLACSYECHEGHDLYELYTKRNFRCDCGNSKFSDNKCKLYPTKDPSNSKNIYNQNFKGMYCICSRPYPDPEDEIEDEMIQCIMCEDWYHGRHLGEVKELPADYEDMVCHECMNKFDFLWAYDLNCHETKKLKSEETKGPVDVEEKKNSSDLPEGGKEKTTDTQLPTCEGDAKINGCHAETDKKEPEKEKSEDFSAKEDELPCLLKLLQSRDITIKHSATFWKAGWRAKLCTCPVCMEMYRDRGVEFVVDESDTVTAYERRGQDKQTPSSQYDKGLQALSSMGRVQQVEVIQGFNDMKSELSTYLKKFAENGKVVREEDIREFFSQMEARKRQKTASPFQYFCK